MQLAKVAVGVVPHRGNPWHLFTFCLSHQQPLDPLHPGQALGLRGDLGKEEVAFQQANGQVTSCRRAMTKFPKDKEPSHRKEVEPNSHFHSFLQKPWNILEYWNAFKTAERLLMVSRLVGFVALQMRVAVERARAAESATLRSALTEVRAEASVRRANMIIRKMIEKAI